MIRFAGGGLVAVLLLLLWVYCILDVIATDEILIRSGLPKIAWLIIVIILPTIGSLAWLALGRPAYAGWRPGDTQRRQAGRPVAAEDQPGFGRTTPTTSEAELRRREDALRRREAEIARREQEAQRREDGQPPAD